MQIKRATHFWEFETKKIGLKNSRQDRRNKITPDRDIITTFRGKNQFFFILSSYLGLIFSVLSP